MTGEVGLGYAANVSEYQTQAGAGMWKIWSRDKLHEGEERGNLD